MTGPVLTSRALTGVLAGVAAVLAVALVLVLSSRPGGDPVVGDETSAPAAASTTSRPVPSPSLPSSEVGAHDASPGPTPYSQTEDARRRWEPVAAGFGRTFTATHGRSAARWRAALDPYVTAAVRNQLATADLANVSDGDFTGLEVAEYGEDKVAVYLHYDTGLTLVGYLIDDGIYWRLYAYDRWED